MPGRSYTQAEKMAAVHLARVSTVESAGKALHIDSATIKGWMETVEIPSDQWAALEQLFLAKATELGARGVTTGLVATLTAAGVSARNARYSSLISRRDARREAEQAQAEEAAAPTFWSEANRLLSSERRDWLKGYIDVLINFERYHRKGGGPITDADEQEATETAIATALRATLGPNPLGYLASASDAELAAHDEAVLARIRPFVKGYTVSKGPYNEYIIRKPDGEHVYQGSSVPREMKHLGVLHDTPEPPAVDVSPRPALEGPETPQAPRDAAEPYVLSVDDREHRSWRRWE